MYTQHFNLSAEPFGLTPDPAFLYPSAGHREALAALRVGLQGRRGLIVMVGEVGTGKTTLLYSLLPQISSDIKVAYITNTKLSFKEMFAQALADFGVTENSGSRGALLNRFKQFLLRCAEQGQIATLVIDEAQNLDADCLENLRLLSNVETFTEKLLQIVLVGQPELVARLSRPELRQLTERIAVYCEVKPLSWRDSRAYVAHRLHQAGGSLNLFTTPALALLLWKAAGNPRRINMFCHDALLFAYGHDAPRVSLSLALRAVHSKLAYSHFYRRAQRAARQTPPAPASVQEAPVSVRRRAEAPRAAASQPAPEDSNSARMTPAVRIAALVLPLALGAAVANWALSPRPFDADPIASRADAAAAPQASEPLEATTAFIPDIEVAAPVLPQTASLPAASLPVDEPESIEPAMLSVDSGPAMAVATGAAGSPAEGLLSLAPAVEVPLEQTSYESGAAAPVSVEAAPALEQEAIVDPAMPPASDPEAARTMPRLLRVPHGSNLSQLTRQIYGRADSTLIEQVRLANPRIINPNLISVGDILFFPALAAAEGPEE